jgi:hypothetical protein
VLQGNLAESSTQQALAEASLQLLPLQEAAAGSSSSSSSSSSTALFDLVTGTPPYFDLSAGALPAHEESARCLFESRGGIEAYMASAAQLLAPGGLFVVCETSLALLRGYAAAQAAGLRVLARVDAVPVQGKPPLFCVYVCARAAEQEAAALAGTAAALAGAFELPCSAAGSSGSPAAALPLAYQDMHSPEYGAYLQPAPESALAPAPAPAAEPELAAAEASAQLGFEKRPARKSRQPQAARGAHVEHAGKPVAQELASLVVVRAASGERTPEYVRLLWEMGKPGK